MLSAVRRRQNATGLFCIPFFHIIGVSKCGTTDLFRRLSLHPHVAPSHNKVSVRACACECCKRLTPCMQGPHFWDERHTFDWYLNIYATSSVPVVKSDPANVIIGDASSNTLTFSGVGIRHQRNVPNGVTLAKVLAALQPGLRLIAVLRNPVDRLYSSYFYYGHYAARYGATAAGFHDFAVAQVAAYAACPPTKSRRECAVEGYGRAEQLVKGMYSMFLPDYLAAFPREQVLVMRSETYGDDVEAGLRAAMKHIGLEKPADEQWSPMVDAKRSNKRGSNGRSAGGDTGDMMRSDTRQLLNAFYQSYNVELATLLDDNSFMWHTQPPPSSQ
jgi:N-acetylgalactosamine 4-sulfate 6-O-sulfotransferase